MKTVNRAISVVPAVWLLHTRFVRVDMMDTNSEIGIWRKRLLYRSWHRGMREMDLIMGRFADRHLAKFGTDELTAYEAILELEDPVLYGWISGRDPLPEAWNTPLMSLIMNFKMTDE